MADKPIIFSGPMVRALLEGRKTQTRRILKPQPWNPELEKDPDFDGWQSHHAFEVKARQGILRSTHGIGTRLWVREKFSGLHRLESYPPSQWLAAQVDTYDGLEIEEAAPIWYWADGNPKQGDWTRPRPSIHMPRWASRLTLTVTDVRVQRLQEISGDDALAEGICNADGRQLVNCYGPECPTDNEKSCNLHGCWGQREDFRDLWNSLHGPDAWEANPWVVALTFDVHHCNIDALPPRPTEGGA